MAKKICKKAAALLLTFVICLCALPVNEAQAAGDAMSLSAVKDLLNAEKLYPQKTGYEAIDRMLEQLLAPYKEKDTYTKVKALYEWSVNNISYSWAGYSQSWAPAYDCFTLKYDLAYETGLPEAYPKDMIYRTYHMLTDRTGVCYDWGILFAVMARYIGIESYVHTGYLRIGDWRGHHGWTELKLGGKNYIFDAQQDNRSKGIYGHIIYDHFGIAPGSAGRYSQETGANAARDKSLLPVTAERVRVANITVSVSRSGKVEGAGPHPWGEEATLKAVGDTPLAGWYTSDGSLLSTEPEYTFVPEGDTRILALFENDYFVDIPAGVWYLEDVSEGAARGLFQGTTPVTFEPGQPLTRVMLAGLLFRAAGEAAPSEPAPFADINREAWYAPAVDWTYQTGITQGASKDRFVPNDKLTREQAAAMVIRYLEYKGVTAPMADAEFQDMDAVSPYAKEYMAKAQALEIFKGYEDGTVRPKKTVNRCEGASLLMRVVRCAEAA